MKVNFSAKKHDLGFALMNQLSTSQKRIPRTQQDIASDYFALRKEHSGTRWVFSEGRNSLNLASHCDIAWAGALASHAHTEDKGAPGAAHFARRWYPDYRRATACRPKGFRGGSCSPHAPQQ
jgi:hypothetical protein